jgi:hypothetical protein
VYIIIIKLKKLNMKRILRNIKTSLFGSIAGLPMITEGIAHKNWTMLISGIGILLTGLLAKDNDVQ